MSANWVRVGPLPAWLDRARLLGDGDWSWDGTTAEARLPRETAADVAARLRGLGLDGSSLTLDVRPRLQRTVVRAGRTRVARAMRETSPGFTRPGVRLDEEGRRSLTPERLALALGQRVAGKRVLDLCCGAGGNAIGFARAGCAVTAVELDGGRAAIARHNARRYDVDVEVVQGDGLALAATHDADVLFVDPPWGGWDHQRTSLEDLPLLAAALAHRDRFETVLAKVPPSFDTHTVDGARAEAWFGHAPGDVHRIKFVLLTWGA
jgi:hypothetical protein